MEEKSSFYNIKDVLNISTASNWHKPILQKWTYTTEGIYTGSLIFTWAFHGLLGNPPTAHTHACLCAENRFVFLNW